jgi:hypothetical protein
MLKIGSDFYILASSLASRRSTRVLAGGESFALLDAGGDILESPLEALGFFHRDTRYLSRFELKIAGEVPYLLNSYLSDGPDYGTKQHCICGQKKGMGCSSRVVDCREHPRRGTIEDQPNRTSSRYPDKAFSPTSIDRRLH